MISAYLPNKKIWALIVFVLIMFVGWFYYSGYKEKKIQLQTEKQKSDLLAVVTNQVNSFEEDADADGLKDWEEMLWKTDQKNFDTDGDGASDGEETSQNRDPLKPGPDDKISAKIEDLVAANKKQAEEEQTVTANYAKKFLTAYLLMKKEKGELTEDNKQELVESFMSNLSPMEVKDKYLVSDLKIAAKNFGQETSDYAVSMKKLLAEDEHVFIDNRAVFERLLEKLKNKTDDYEKDIWALNYSAGMYVWMAEQLIKTSVPNEFSKNQLIAANSFYKGGVALEAMANIQIDPIKGMMARKLHEDELQKSFDALTAIQNDLMENYGLKI